MKKFSIDQVEDIQITIDNIKGLAQVVNDLTGENVLLFTKPDLDDKATLKRLGNLYSKLMALSAATIDMADKAESQLNNAVSSYYKERRR